MIKEKEVWVGLGGTNSKYYESKGYAIPKRINIYGNMCMSKNAKLKVKVEDLKPNSDAIITAICENLNCKTKEIKLSYDSYYRCLQDETGLYYCKDCYTIKMFKLAELKQKRGELKKGQMYYWNFRENLLKETSIHIEKYGTVDNMPNTNKSLYAAIKAHDEDIFDIYMELGFSKSNLKNLRIEPNYEEVLGYIKLFIEKFNSFPLSKDFGSDELPISLTNFYTHWSSFDELKMELNCYNENDLRDKKGNTNRSLYEVYVANILFEWGSQLIYKRNAIIDMLSGEYRSDFYIEANSPLNISGKNIHIEVFGYPKNAKDIRGAYYNTNRKIKELIYKDISESTLFISIERKDVNTNYKKIQDNIYRILSPYLLLDRRDLMWDEIKHYDEKSESKILNEMLTYCNNDLTMQNLIKTEKGKHIYAYVGSKFGGIHYFIRRYNLDTKIKRNYWNKDILFNTFIDLINNHNCGLKRNELEKFSKLNSKYKGVTEYVYKENGLVYWKVKFLKYCLENNISLNNNFNIKAHLIDMLKGVGHSNIKPESKTLAQELFDTYFILDEKFAN